MMDWLEKLLVIGILMIFAVVGHQIYNNNVNTRWVCDNEAVVLDILSVNYRSATVMTNKGEIVLYQSNTKDGDIVCLKGHREDIDE